MCASMMSLDTKPSKATKPLQYHGRGGRRGWGSLKPISEWEDEARMKKLEAKAEAIRKNLNTLEQFKEYYIKVHGADAFARQMSSLLDELMAVDIASSSMSDDGSMDA